MSPLRLFTALELPAAARAALPVPGEEWRPLAQDALHVTLAFLGWRPEEDVSLIAETLRGVALPVGEVSLGAARLLPPRAPRVLAVALDDPSGSLVALQAAVSEALVAAGVYEAEKRAWLPHVTVGRARRGASISRRAALPAVEPVRFRPESMALFRSVLHPAGARYEALERVELPAA